MKNADLMVNGPDQRTHYNAIQLALPVFTPAVLPADDKVFSFLDAVKGVDFSHYVKPILSHNTHSHDRGMLVRVLLFGFMDNVLSLRELEQRCKTDIRYIYLSREKHPSKMAFSRVCQSLTMSIQDLFFDLSEKLVRKMGIDPNVQYVDGTKIEANAQKNTFVYKKRIINARKRMYGSISDEIRCLNQAYGYDYALKKAYCAQEVWYIVQYLMEVMVHEKIEICYGTGKRKSAFQKHYDLLMKYAMKLDEYEYWLFVIGDRRSCSKTDLDATFMATKWDYC
jgi:transposase